MKTRVRLKFPALILLESVILVATFIAAAGEAQSGLPERQIVAQGRWIYEVNCAICHGVSADGRGMAAHMFVTQPRDFTKGIFKFRSTPSGSLPTDDDLIRSITEGLDGTPMVAQPQLAPQELRAVVSYIKTFSERFVRETPLSPVEVPRPPAGEEGLLSKGKHLYVEAGCDSCHGSKGSGDGPSAEDLVDVWGYTARPGDLTTPAKRGSSPRSIYQTPGSYQCGGRGTSCLCRWSRNFLLMSVVAPMFGRADVRQTGNATLRACGGCKSAHAVDAGIGLWYYLPGRFMNVGVVWDHWRCNNCNSDVRRTVPGFIAGNDAEWDTITLISRFQF